MTLQGADRDSARVTAVIHSLDRSGLPAPIVESVIVRGNSAYVRLTGTNGLCTTVRLIKKAGHWSVQSEEAA